MSKCISCGGFNKYFIYILLAIFFKIFYDSLYGFNYNDSFEEVKIFNTRTQDYLSWHGLIHQIFCYIGTTIISFLFYKYEVNASKKEGNDPVTNTTNNVKKKQNLEIQLIHNDAEENIDINSDKSSFFICLLVIFLWISAEELIDVYSLALKDLDFWMFELLIVTAFSRKLFKIEIFNHQKFAMWFTLVPCVLKVSTIFLSFGHDGISDKNLTILYYYDKLYIPIGISIYMILITSRAYANTKIKWFMDLKYISPSKLLIYYGIIGTIICTLTAIVTTYIKCDANFKLFNYICKIPYIGSDIKVNSTFYTTYINDTYLENFNIYFDTLLGKVNTEYDNNEIIIEIAIIFFGIFSFFFYKYFSLKVIQHLTPVYLILSNPILFIIQKIVLLINNIFKDDDHSLFKKGTIAFVESKFFLDMAGDIFSILGFLIYLEIIELKFCNYDYNIKSNISRRSFIESNEINEPEKSLINDEEAHDDEDSVTFTCS